MKRHGASWVICVLVGLSMAGGPAALGATDQVTFALDWIVNGTHAGHFLVSTSE